MKRGLNPGKSLADKLQLLPKKVPRLIQENLDGIASPYLGNIVVISDQGQQDALGSEIISFLEAEGFALEAAPVYVRHKDHIGKVWKFSLGLYVSLFYRVQEANNISITGRIARVQGRFP